MEGSLPLGVSLVGFALIIWGYGQALAQSGGCCGIRRSGRAIWRLLARAARVRARLRRRMCPARGSRPWLGQPDGAGREALGVCAF